MLQFRLPLPSSLLAVALACLTAGTFAAPPAPTAAPAIDSARLLRDITTLSSDDFEGRYPGSHGEELTVSFLVNELKSYGLKPGNPDGSYVQNVPMNGYTAKPALTLVSAAGTTTLRCPDDFVAVSYTDEAVTRASGSELVFVGYGIGMKAGWMHAKLGLVLILIAHHVYLGKLMIDFKHDRNRHGHKFYRWLNEIPAAPVLLLVVILVVVKPF